MTRRSEEEEQEPFEPEAETPDYSHTSVGMTDADLRNAVSSAMRIAGVLAVIVGLGFWWRFNWQSGLLVLIGAAISSASLWEWMRMMTAVNARMDAGVRSAEEKTRPMGSIVVGFVARLGLTLLVLYASLRYLHGNAFALAAGLGLGVVTLSVEAIKLMRR